MYSFLLYILVVPGALRSEAAGRRCFFKIGVLKNFAMFTGKHLHCTTQVFSCEYGKILKNSLIYRRPLVAASVWFRKCFINKSSSPPYSNKPRNKFI